MAPPDNPGTVHRMDPHVRNHLDRVSADELARHQRMERAWTAYHEELVAPLKPTVSKTGQVTSDDVPVNLAAVIVDAAAHFLCGTPPEVQVTTDSADGKVQTALDQILQANRWPTKALNMATSGAVTGHVAIKLRVTPEGPRFSLIDPAHLTIITDPDDIDTDLRYVIEYETVDRAAGLPVIRRQTCNRDQSGVWTIIDEQQFLGNAGRTGWELIAEEIWTHQCPPVLHTQNLPTPHEIYGRPDITDALINLSQSARFTISNLQRIVRLHAHPKMVAKGVRIDEIKAGPDSLISLPSPDSSLEVLETHADMAATNALFDRIVDAVHRQGATPPVATGKVDNVGQLSALALRILYGPLLAKTDAKRTTYGDLFRTLMAALLELGGHGTHTIELVWPNPLPQDEAAEAAAAQAWQAAGVSKETTLAKAGFDPAVEAARRETETATTGDGLATFTALNDTLLNPPQV